MEVRILMDRATQTLDHFPSISQIEEIAKELDIKHIAKWRYKAVSDCLTCGGPGWHWVTRIDGVECPVACDDCEAGKNMQMGPKGTITWTQKQCPHCSYSRPGK